MPPSPPSMVREVAVVIPARDEEALLPYCLKAVGRATKDLHREYPSIIVKVLVVLDSCRDGSIAVARAAGVSTLELEAGSVGVARRSGVQKILDAYDGDPASLWLASTDADTHVPRRWLTVQVEAAAAGVDAVVGTVEPDGLLTGAARDEWFERHDLAEGHTHVHGANLGVRSSAYLAVGGFREMASHEDVDLVRRLVDAKGVSVRSTDAHRVTTSSRLQARAPHGFSTYLRNLVASAHDQWGAATAPAGSQ